MSHDPSDLPGPDTSPEEPGLDLSAWEPQLPPGDFADRLLARLAAEEPARPVLRLEPRRPPGRLARGLGALLLAAALAAGLFWLRGLPPGHGEAEALDRREVSIGSRARAVLEPGAHLRWDGGDVAQDRGDVFYRVEPGGRFRVRTPAGDVEVQGTCFTVKIRPDDGSSSHEENRMDRRDIRSGAIGAALSALAFVAVHEGRVAVSHAQGRVELRAGEGAITGRDGVHKVGSLREGERRLEDSAGAEDAQLAQTNQTLAAQVQVYRGRLESLSDQRNDLEKRLHQAEEKLAAAQHGGAPVPTHSPYDPTPEEWVELAKKGTVKYRVPCLDSDRWSKSLSPERLNKMGLGPDDSATLKGAFERSSQRLWSQIRPLCAAALGASGDVIDKLGPETCTRLVYDLSLKSDKEAATEAHTQAAEVRAGLRPEPAPDAPQHPVLKLFLLMTGAGKVFESDLASSLGPEEAHRVVNSESLCAWQSTIGGGKERDAKNAP